MDRAERFSDLYRGCYEAVLRYALRRTDPETALDVAAETFLIAWRRLNALPADGDLVMPWLYGVARRVLANAGRSKRRADNVTTRLRHERRDTYAPDAAAAIVESARLTAGGSPIYAATFRVTSTHGSGSATVQLAELSAAGAVVKVFARHAIAYSTQQQEGVAVTGCQVLTVDAAGQDAIAYCPDFGRIENGTFTALAHSSGDHLAAW